jgi:Protein of unknown function (DUF1214)
MSVDFIKRRSLLRVAIWLGAAAIHLPGERLRAAVNGKRGAKQIEGTGSIMSDGLEWEKLIDGLRPLGDAMRSRIPERLRGDPHIMAESMRLLLSGLARASSDALVGDRRHPMFVPELNVAQNIFQPNADTIYKSCLIESGGSYLLKGDRGTTRMMILAQMGPDTLRTGKHHPVLDQGNFDNLQIDGDGNFEVVVSPQKPAGHKGDWWPLHDNCEKLMIRIVSCNWGVEREPRFGIARLDVDEAKGRPSVDALHQAFGELAGITAVCALAFPTHVQELRDQGFLNTLKVFDVSQMSGLQGQSYYEGAYELADDEALITEVKIPESYKYWSIILTNELYETTDWYNNQSSLNDMQGVVDSDGIFRTIISARDPGVHNWLDTAGYESGAVQGRWFGATATPNPNMRKVKLVDVMDQLPGGTKRVTKEERAVALRNRRIAAQRRAIW